jgi:transcriptional regulator with XRE-family HTH domain
MSVNHALVEARTQARLSQRDLAQKVRDAGKRLGVATGCNATTVGRWEAGDAVPQPRMLACLEEALGSPAASLGFGELPAADASWIAPPGFPLAVIGALWVTSYLFSHDGRDHHHADIARVAADGDQVRITNGPARTEGRAVPFGNEIRAQLAGRHLIGQWRNTSDTRYFGSVHLAVLPGETVMEGYYTGLATDVAVSVSRWRWVRLDGDPPGSLQDPAVLYKIVMDHSQYDAPLTAAAIGEQT